ncbi:MAG: C4-dicarboxylate ABC transporter substrate-binding protein [Confluentimicrobium sp.]|uniref:TRAP transporter small permease protein n=1 Tax=Hyphomonas atlantica TaxID=1280948 RepID=A0A356W6N1_9PROT|nr:C4-dicarboxylate ABC transporter substrate-binding protein [Actibacterium sp.]MBF52116.1 C4-dicarboxylate ABC transporter substrate-binding protein [Actibacterium sp.]HBQ48695.1 C4-dicarboxylate ABC transporter substrate-binding protein [Hyphomonas atlantica]
MGGSYMQIGKLLSWVVGSRTTPMTSRLLGIASRITMLLLPIIAAAMIYEVIKRYVFAGPTIWVNEFSVWLAAIIYLVAGLYATQQRAHISITTVVDYLPVKARMICELFSLIVLTAYVVAIVAGGLDGALEALLNWESLGTAFNPPVPATIKPLILIVSVLVLLQSVLNFVETYHRRPAASEDR